MGREVLADGHNPTQLPAPLLSRLWFTAECLPPGRCLRTATIRAQFPAGARIFLQAARQHAAESPKLRSLRAARRQPAIFIWGRGRQAMHLPCKQAYMGALPTDSTNFNCGKLDQ